MSEISKFSVNGVEYDVKDQQARTTADEAHAAVAVVHQNINEYSNTVKKTVSGEVVSINDASPVPHVMKGKVSGKNLFDLNAVVNASEQTTLEGDVLTTTFSSGTTFVNKAIKDGHMTLPAGTYTATLVSVSENVVVTFYVYDAFTKEYITHSNVDSSNNYTFTFEAPSDFIFSIGGKHTESGEFFNTYSYKVQLEKGNVATEYEPWVDPTTVTVTRCGKNVFDITATRETSNGVTMVVNQDGTVKLNGTATATSFFTLGSFYPKVGAKYRLSGGPENSGTSSYMLYIHNVNTNVDYVDLGTGKNFTALNDEQRVVIAVYKGAVLNNLVFYPMIVYGDNEGRYEPYIGETYVPNQDGTVAISSESSFMTVMTNTEGIGIDVEYNLDLATALQDQRDYVESVIDDQNAAVEAVINDQNSFARNNYTNALTVKKRDKVVRMDDVSPVPHIVKSKITGKNLVRLENPNTTVEHSGITFTVQDDGSVVATGICATGATAYYGITKNSLYETGVPLVKGKYTISKTNQSGCRVSVGVRKNENANRVLYSSTDSNSATFEVTNDTTRIDVILCVDSGTMINGFVFRPQVEAGEVETEYEPFVKPETVEVTKCGKNLLPFPYYESDRTRAGITFSSNNGVITANGTSTGAYLKIVDSANTKLYLHKGVTYTLSGAPANGSNSTYYIYLTTVDGESYFDIGNGVTITPTESGYVSINIVIKSGTVASNLVFKPMLTIGQKQDDFEPYSCEKYTPEANGTLEFVSISPTMSVMTNNAYANIDIEYHKDINSLFHELDTLSDLIDTLVNGGN